MCGSVVTSPVDVVKTRLQSDLLRTKHAGIGIIVGDSVVRVQRPGELLWHFVDCAYHLVSILLPPSPLPEFIHIYTHIHACA